MPFFNIRNNRLRFVSISGLLFILYGYLCRWTGIYFFWESKSVGWVLLFVSLIGLINQRIQRRKEKNSAYKGYVEKCGIFAGVLSLLLKITVFFLVLSSEAYRDARKFLLNDSITIAEVGQIKNFSVVPWGGIHSPADSSGIYRSAKIILILKGEKKYKQLTVSLKKYPDQTEWKVSRIQE